MLLAQNMEYNKKAAELIINFIILFLATLFLFCFFQIMEVNVFGHDDFYYIDNYSWAIPQEGRWLNYFAFPLIRVVPQKLAIIITFLSLFIYIWICVTPLVNKKTAGIIVFSGLLICPLYTLLQFPTTPLLSYMALAALALYKFLCSNCDYRKFFIISGIIFCGLYNHFYNFVPLLFLSDILNGRLRLCKFICWYIIGFITGFLFSEIICYFYCGHMIMPASWRNVQPIYNIEDIARNLTIEAKAFYADLTIAGKWPAIFVFLSFVVALLFAAKNGFKNFNYWAAALLIIMCVIFSVYVQAAPLGIIMDHRTAGPLYIALIFMIVICYGKRTILIGLFLTFISIPLFITDYKSIIYIKTIGNIYCDNLKKIAVEPGLYNLVFLIGDDEIKNAEQNISKINHVDYHPVYLTMSSCLALRAAGNSAGFKNVIINNIDVYPQFRDKIEHTNGEWHKNEFYAYRLIGDVLAVKLAWP